MHLGKEKKKKEKKNAHSTLKFKFKNLVSNEPTNECCPSRSSHTRRRTKTTNVSFIPGWTRQTAKLEYNGWIIYPRKKKVKDHQVHLPRHSSIHQYIRPIVFIIHHCRPGWKRAQMLAGDLRGLVCAQSPSLPFPFPSLLSLFFLLPVPFLQPKGARHPFFPLRSLSRLR